MASDVFLAVESGHTQFGVVPFENSTTGPVDTTLDCLIDHANQTTGVKTFAETYVKINHCLVGHAAPHRTLNGSLTPAASGATDQAALSVPDKKFEHVTDVYSHPQGLKQCQDFLYEHLKSAELHEVASTSEAAAIVAKMQVPTAAAISSHLAGEVYGLDILASGVQDTEDNATRFLILTKTIPDLPTDSPEQRDSYKVLLAFSVNHDSPGALADALHVFKSFGLNLTSINSRPNKTKAWHYVFLVELICLDTLGGVVKSRLEEAVESLKKETETFKSLGYWKVTNH